jgi:tRNA pseudouridine38-40 synthase
VIEESLPPPLEPRNIKLTVEYEGTAYHGWQSQRGLPSVQGELERAVGRLVAHPVTIWGSGRTDRGVHALGQVANFRTERTIPVEKLLLGINTYLPDDIRVVAAEEAPADFHARYSARGKRYRYTFLRSPVARPLVRRFAAQVAGELDLEAMRRAARSLRGVRDFRAFEGSAKRSPPAPGAPPRSTVRTVAAVVVRESGPLVFVDAFGRGFLYGMVRTIAGTLLEVGRGRRSAGELESVLGSLDRRRAGVTAPAHGLCLLSVYYREGELEREADRALEGRPETEVAAVEHERNLKMLTGSDLRAN